MRNAQKQYFRTRTTSDLKKCKHLERLFDEAVQECLYPSNQLTFENFNTLPMDIFDKDIEPLM